MTIDAAALLAAWETAAAAPHLERAPSLLLSLGCVAPETELEQMTVGGCDARLFMLRRAVFGDVLEATAVCPTCRAQLEWELSLAALAPDADAERPNEVRVAAQNYEIDCRPLRNRDLSDIAARGASAGVSDLLERCVTAARGPDGADIPAADLPAALAAPVLEAVAASDPGAQVAMTVRCVCGAEWTDELDIRGIVWTEVTDWVSQTLTEVHTLARAYGWSEAEILALSEWRRRWYLEAVA